MKSENPEMPDCIPKPSERAREWLDHANVFLLSAQKLIGLETAAIPTTACLMAQASTERFLKAFLIATNPGITEKELRGLGHDLAGILKACAQIDSEFNNLYDEADLLNSFKPLYDYPPLPSETISEEQSIKAVTSAERIYHIVMKALRERKF